KVFVRGRCVNFSPSIINQYLGRSIDEIAEMEVSQDEHPDICTADDVPCAREADLTLDYRLYEGSHAADIAGPLVRNYRVQVYTVNFVASNRKSIDPMRIA
ncbi:hypothetical protein A2U01_0036907, partial [Trifolium medium]|nr:hypothetical protein [Trifolium medium]